MNQGIEWFIPGPGRGMWVMNKNELLAALRAHSRTNYETGGWDFLEECWEDDKILEELATLPEGTTPEAAIAHFGKFLAVSDDRRKDILAEIF